MGAEAPRFVVRVGGQTGRPRLNKSEPPLAVCVLSVELTQPHAVVSWRGVEHREVRFEQRSEHRPLRREGLAC